MYSRTRNPVDNYFRFVWSGSVTYDKSGRAVGMTGRDYGYIYMGLDGDFFGRILRFTDLGEMPTSRLLTAPLYTLNNQEIARIGSSGVSPEESGEGLPAFRSFGGGKYFYDGWQLDPFNTSLV